MKIYTKIILDKNNKVLKEEFFEYLGTMAFAGIHYDFKSQKGNKLMEKQAQLKVDLERKEKKLSAVEELKQALEQIASYRNDVDADLELMGIEPTSIKKILSYSFTSLVHFTEQFINFIE